MDLLSLTQVSLVLVLLDASEDFGLASCNVVEEIDEGFSSAKGVLLVLCSRPMLNLKGDNFTFGKHIKNKCYDEKS